ncbi:TPA: RNA polymerase sigma factor [Streptococcus pyogenes]|uniref:RNA polymerase sigma factor n=1 Tax=Streptococcus pyogenes TaxID=1314 RepID=UPI000DA376B5|nr:sigma factor-like helix-turn-helix DNA-binding protein [Streptococcus pyogenes]SQH09625.1 Sigma-70, region 4 [Streptococcus pyogenes]VHG14305.1 Sigma-70, region 4 [Streptococcus pyogenes]VHH58062.1 Sigma-70, region 4 [Streptococcus pyogenes]VHH60966.1 Sigma-70, region 4 [Streptococcus pyogenes]VHH77141.1 Sigma-70, region 4 [Streptococcus pyogenes]
MSSYKVKKRREAKIEEAVKANDWEEVSRLLQQEQSNAERRDRYHKKRSLEESTSRKDGKQRERHELVASPDLNPEENLTLKELKQDILKAKEILAPVDRKIVEMVAEHGLNYKKTARYISEHYKKMSDITVKSHYLKALRELAHLLEEYR